MKSLRPPRIAVSLLERFGPPDQDALVGDLYEEFARGRSSAWFWRQVLAAIVVGAWREVRADPRRAMCGTLIGWLALGTLSPVALRLFNDGPIALSMFVWRPLDASLFWLLARLSAPVIMSSGLLWRVSRSPGIVLMFAATMVAVSIVSFPLNAYTMSGATPSARALYLSALPTACLIGFVVLPISVLLGPMAFSQKPVRRS